MTIITSGGTQIFIGGYFAAQIPAQLIDATFIEVGQVESLGEFGTSADPQNINVQVDDQGMSWIVQKRKGPRDAGSLLVTVALDPQDQGQRALIEAEGDDEDGDYAFKIEMGRGTLSFQTFIFFGVVLSTKSNIGAADTVTRRSFEISINSLIYEG